MYRLQTCGNSIFIYLLLLLCSLSDVEEGGETHFNKLGLSVKPKKGRALVWPSVIDSDPEFWDGRM
jgi:prolyl 4-hydroxylase